MGKMKNREYHEAIGLLAGLGTAMILCLGSTAGLAQLIIDEKVGEGSTDYFLAAILALSVFGGCQVAAKLQRKSVRLIPVIVTVLFMIILLLVGLIMEGAFQNLWLSLGATAAGGVISSILHLKKPGRGVRRKHYTG